MQHLTPDPAFCHFLQGSHCLPNSRYTTGILFSTRFYSIWSLCVQCVRSKGMWMCVCLLLFCCQNHTQAFCKEVPAGLRAGHQAPRFSLSGASSDPATWEWRARAFPAIFSSSDADLGYSPRSRQELGRAVSASSKQLLGQPTTCSAGTRGENKSYVQSFPSGEGKSRQSRMSTSSPDCRWASSGCGQQESKDHKGGGGGGTLTNLQLANTQEQKTMKRAEVGSLPWPPPWALLKGFPVYTRYHVKLGTTCLDYALGEVSHIRTPVKGTQFARHRLLWLEHALLQIGILKAIYLPRWQFSTYPDPMSLWKTF